MKRKIISILLCMLIIMSAMTVFASAAGENNTYEYEVNGTEYTVEFETDNISAEKQELIAAKILDIDEANVMPANIWCDIFGHDLAVSTVTVIEHKVRTYTPRCRIYTFDVTYCEDCDYTVETLIATSYVNCCPVE